MTKKMSACLLMIALCCLGLTACVATPTPVVATPTPVVTPTPVPSPVVTPTPVPSPVVTPTHVVTVAAGETKELGFTDGSVTIPAESNLLTITNNLARGGGAV